MKIGDKAPTVGTTLDVSGIATFASSAIFSAQPIAQASASLVRLGPSIIQGGNSASGTYIGINPSAFGGDFLNFQTNSSSQLTVSATGTLDLSGVLITGSSNIRITSSTGFIDGSSILLGQVGTSTVTSSPSGLEAVGERLTLLKGCAANQIKSFKL